MENRLRALETNDQQRRQQLNEAVERATAQVRTLNEQLEQARTQTRNTADLGARMESFEERIRGLTGTLEELRHSASHVLATAVLRLFPDAKLDIGPPTDTGFYYDIDLDHKLTMDDLARLEDEMKKIAEENQRFDRKEVSREEAVEIIKSRGQERYKLGRLADIPEGEKISFYTNGEVTDL